MGLFDKTKELFNRILGKDKKELPRALQLANEYISKEANNNNGENIAETTVQSYNPIDLPEGEIVPISNEEVLDTTSPEFEQILKHNLDILIKDAKQKGQVDKFMLIREDDFFPQNWQWSVLSQNTNLEKINTPLSFALREQYAYRQAGISDHEVKNGMVIPKKIDKQKENEALSKVDKKFAAVLLPSRFRSTKHFTVNTPLEATGDYNSVHTNRNYVVIDNMDAFLNSGYGYSVSYHDAYLDVTHEPLSISDEAVVLIEDEKYEQLMSDSKVSEELDKRRVIRYKGETDLAVSMVLTSMGALPSKIGTRYAEYDQELNDILDKSIRTLAEEHDLAFDQNHGGLNGHFTHYYDDLNQDYEKVENEYISFLSDRFPESKELFNEYLMRKGYGGTAVRIVDRIGIEELLQGISDYNAMTNERFEQRSADFFEGQKRITPQMHEQFTTMVHLINDFYNDVYYDSEFDSKVQIEENIQKFFQGNTVQEQQGAAIELWGLIRPRMHNKTQSIQQNTQVNDNLSHKGQNEKHNSSGKEI